MTDETKSPRDERSAYEPPVVEDLDRAKGPVETAAGALPPSVNPGAAAPTQF